MKITNRTRKILNLLHTLILIEFIWFGLFGLVIWTIILAGEQKSLIMLTFMKTSLPPPTSLLVAITTPLFWILVLGSFDSFLTWQQIKKREKKKQKVREQRKKIVEWIKNKIL